MNCKIKQYTKIQAHTKMQNIQHKQSLFISAVKSKYESSLLISWLVS